MPKPKKPAKATTPTVKDTGHAIRVSTETYIKLLSMQGRLAQEYKRRQTMDDVIAYMLYHWQDHHAKNGW